MGARKKRITLSDEWRQKISASMICNRLISHIKGEIELTPTQIQAANILLRKVVPDLAAISVDHQGQIEHHHKVAEQLPADDILRRHQTIDITPRAN